jgi:hypothetical protein
MHRWPVRNGWIAGVFRPRERVPSVRPSAETSFRDLLVVPSNGRVLETGGPCHDGRFSACLMPTCLNRGRLNMLID